MSESTAAVFAAYLGMTPENAGWAYTSGFVGGQHGAARIRTTLTATSPLSAAPTPGWLEVLLKAPIFEALFPSSGVFCAECGIFDGEERTGCHRIRAAHPTHAVALALVAADPALRARLEACGDWEGVK